MKKGGILKKDRLTCGRKSELLRRGKKEERLRLRKLCEISMEAREIGHVEGYGEGE